MNNFKISAPWVTYAREVEALFSKDPDITVNYDVEENIIILKVENADKADALTQILPSEKDFGGVKLQIKVVPANNLTAKSYILFKRAFDGNPIFSRFEIYDSPYTSNPIGFCVFVPEIVQFWNDNLGDINGNVTTLYQNIADDVFENAHDGIMFNTESIN